MSPKRIKELTHKKHRRETGLFLVEGHKNIEELLASHFEVLYITGTRPFLSVINEHIESYEKRSGKRIPTQETHEEELVKMGTLLSNNAGVAVAKQKKEVSLEALLFEAETNIVVALDDIRDPGNLGTIIRTSDWYGVTHIIASPTTTDFYNAKVIASSMGSFTRVHVTYLPLQELLEAAQLCAIPIIAALLVGESTHEASLPQHGILLMGSESHGVSEESLMRATHQVMIPRFGKAESLNVSTATAILLDTLRRQTPIRRV